MFKRYTAEEKAMSQYKFTQLPTGSTVSTVVTLLVSAWFLTAAGAMLTDSHSTGLIHALEHERATAALVPDRYVTIEVEASRSQAKL